MKNDNRTGAARPSTAKPARAGASRLPDCLASLAPTPRRRRGATGRIEPNAFSRAEMREIVLEMIG